jgi:hypothetical protein
VGSLHVLISDFLQLCLMLSALTSMPEALGGLNSGVIYIDTEHKFTSGRLIEIAHSLSPEVLGDNLLQQVHKFQGLPNCYCEQKCVDEMCLRS